MPNRPLPADEAVRRRFAQQKRADTRPELALRRELHRQGLRFRVGYPVPGRSRRTIDIAFTRVKVAVFIDGCFWHRCPDHYVPPRSNAEWWGQKIAKNVERDRDTSAHLEALGWNVVRCWEHDDMIDAAHSVRGGVEMRRRRAEG